MQRLLARDEPQILHARLGEGGHVRRALQDARLRVLHGEVIHVACHPHLAQGHRVLGRHHAQKLSDLFQSDVLAGHPQLLPRDLADEAARGEPGECQRPARLREDAAEVDGLGCENDLHHRIGGAVFPGNPRAREDGEHHTCLDTKAHGVGGTEVVDRVEQVHIGSELRSPLEVHAAHHARREVIQAPTKCEAAADASELRKVVPARSEHERHPPRDQRLVVRVLCGWHPELQQAAPLLEVEDPKVHIADAILEHPHQRPPSAVPGQQGRGRGDDGWMGVDVEVLDPGLNNAVDVARVAPRRHGHGMARSLPILRKQHMRRWPWRFIVCSSLGHAGWPSRCRTR
mmetsp:Transcript_18835/g.60482  ORF Transcript_18835/g.60482 Transcript_18835/m.60482 type:complete len:344 (-) Transcript_18835:103-1134(-)